MKNRKKNTLPLQVFSKEKLEEFRHMSVRQRLQWLEEANIFINTTLGLERRAQVDPRFEVFVKKRK